MNPAQRISELRKNGAPIKTDHTYQSDVTGAVHRVAVYIWTAENSAQGDFFGGQFNGK
jgi:Helix-turn-helix domain